jgi:hypothetical protein
MHKTRFGRILPCLHMGNKRSLCCAFDELARQISWDLRVSVQLRDQAQETPPGVLEKAGLPLPASHLTRTKKLLVNCSTHIQTNSTATKSGSSGRRGGHCNNLGYSHLRTSTQLVSDQRSYWSYKNSNTQSPEKTISMEAMRKWASPSVQPCTGCCRLLQAIPAPPTRGGGSSQGISQALVKPWENPIKPLNHRSLR